MNNGRKFWIAKSVLLTATATMAVLLLFVLWKLPPESVVPTAMQVLLWWGGVSGSVLAMYGAINVVAKRTAQPGGDK